MTVTARECGDLARSRGNEVPYYASRLNFVCSSGRNLVSNMRRVFIELASQGNSDNYLDTKRDIAATVCPSNSRQRAIIPVWARLVQGG